MTLMGDITQRTTLGSQFGRQLGTIDVILTSCLMYRPGLHEITIPVICMYTVAPNFVLVALLVPRDAWFDI